MDARACRAPEYKAIDTIKPDSIKRSCQNGESLLSNLLLGGGLSLRICESIPTLSSVSRTPRTASGEENVRSWLFIIFTILRKYEGLLPSSERPALPFIPPNDEDPLLGRQIQQACKIMYARTCQLVTTPGNWP